MGNACMQLELKGGQDPKPVIRRYDELLEAHESVALALAAVNFEFVVEKLVLPPLRGRFSHCSVFALGTLCRLLEERPQRMVGDEAWYANRRAQTLELRACYLLRV